MEQSLDIYVKPPVNAPSKKHPPKMGPPEMVISHFSNRTIISCDMAIFVKPCFYEKCPFYYEGHDGGSAMPVPS